MLRLLIIATFTFCTALGRCYAACQSLPTAAAVAAVGTGRALQESASQPTIYEKIQEKDEMITVIKLIDTVKLDPFLNNTMPLTFFSPINSAWTIIIPSLEIEDVLQNHVFEELLSVDKLAEMDGEKIVSTNGKAWDIRLMDNTIHFSIAEGPEGLTNCTLPFLPQTSTTISAKNGILHPMDCLFLDFHYERVDPYAPTWAPVGRPPQNGHEPAQLLTPAPAPMVTADDSSNDSTEPESGSTGLVLNQKKVWASILVLGAALWTY